MKRKLYKLNSTSKGLGGNFALDGCFKIISKICGGWGGGERSI